MGTAYIRQRLVRVSGTPHMGLKRECVQVALGFESYVSRYDKWVKPAYWQLQSDQWDGLQYGNGG